MKQEPPDAVVATHAGDGNTQVGEPNRTPLSSGRGADTVMWRR